MNNLKTVAAVFLVCLVGLPALPSQALTAAPQIAQDKESAYNRSLFKHWIDEDKDKCDTRNIS